MIGLKEAISYLRLFTLPFYDNLPDWFLYSLPDGIWLFSYLSVLLLIWDNKISKHNIHWVLLIPSIAIFSEIGQLFEIVSGTFDITDLVFLPSRNNTSNTDFHYHIHKNFNNEVF